MKTYSLKASELPSRQWYLIDAKDLVLGRVASIIAKLLRAKNNPRRTPHMDHGAAVVVVNAQAIHLTHEKKKNYYRHTGYPGGIKLLTSSELLDPKAPKYSPKKVLIHAVKGMLGKNGPLARTRLGHLYIYDKEDHPHEAQKPKMLSVTQWSRKNTRQQEAS